MNGGTGKRPAAHRGQTRYTGKDRRGVRTTEVSPTDRGQARDVPVTSPRPPAPGVDSAAESPPSQGDASTDRLPTRAARRAAHRAAELAATRVPQLPSVAPKGAAERDSPLSPSQPSRAKRGFLGWGRTNRRITVASPSPLLWLGQRLANLARRLLLVAKVVAALTVLAGAVAGGRLAVLHVVASPRFALRELRVGPTAHVTREDIIQRSGTTLGERLLAIDTDSVAGRLARHPWIAAARVRRELPSTLVIDVTERRASAVAVIGGLYLLDEQGHPFKHATLDEADGLVVLTGISRAEYAGLPKASEAAFREALAVLNAYQNPDSLATTRQGNWGGARPPLSEIHIDPRTGFSLFLYDGGAEIRLGRGAVVDKLARLDEIFAAFGPRRAPTLRVVHLDGPTGDRVPIQLAPVPDESPVAAPGLPVSSPADSRPTARRVTAASATAKTTTETITKTAGAGPRRLPATTDPTR